jgi:hypothetical protein
MSIEAKLDEILARLDAQDKALAALEIRAGIRERPKVERVDPGPRINIADDAMNRAFATSEVARRMASAVSDRTIAGIVGDAIGRR